MGAWFSLVFKSAFALVGLGSYLLVFVSIPEGSVHLVGLELAVVRFEQVPAQLSFGRAAASPPDEVTLESDGGELLAHLDAPVEFGEIVTHDTKRAVADFADRHVLCDVLFGDVPDRLVEGVDASVLLTHSRRSRRRTLLRALLARLVY